MKGWGSAHGSEKQVVRSRVERIAGSQRYMRDQAFKADSAVVPKVDLQPTRKAGRRTLKEGVDRDSIDSSNQAEASDWERGVSSGIPPGNLFGEQVRRAVSYGAWYL